ncbi:MAG: glycosyl hydrolase [Phycisphaerae bacterium]
MPAKISVVKSIAFSAAIMASMAMAADWPFEITSAQRPGVIWWWPGSAVNEAGLDFQLSHLKDAGFGTANIVPIYGAKGSEDKYLDFLSPEWINALRYTLSKADELGLQIHMSTCTGWCFGGPDLPADCRDTVATGFSDGKVKLGRGMNVKRPAPGGEGPMIDPYNPQAMKLYLERFDEAFRGLERLPDGQYHDSFEYQGNWTANFLDEFKARRGYDLTPLLETFFADTTNENRELKTRLKYDYRLTLAELHLEFVEVWAQWAKEKGMDSREQAHGSPANLLDVYAAASIPETEMFGAPAFDVPGFRRDERFCRTGDSSRFVMKMASSAAHVAHESGSQIVSSESFTWLREHWHGTLAQIKLSTDLFFLAGVNKILYHGMCYSDPEADWPGWFFYASTKADPQSAIWHDISYLNAYISRCQAVLQAGEPANDILIYWPIADLWMNPDGMQMGLTVHHSDWIEKQPAGYLAKELSAKGYSGDFISDALLSRLSVSNGVIKAPGGSYKAIVVPECEYMPASTFGRLAELKGQGARIIFAGSLPKDVPGNASLDMQRLLFSCTSLVFSDTQTGALYPELEAAGIKPEPMAELGLDFIARRKGSDLYYFIANHTADDFSDWLPFSSKFASATEYDPLDGSAATLPVHGGKDASACYLNLKAGQSTIITLRGKESSQPALATRQAGEPLELKGEWTVDFVRADGAQLPDSFKSDAPVSWTTAPDKRAEAFAGTARYSITFEMKKTHSLYTLRLGDVRESARVRVNGRVAGAAFSLPYEMEVGRLLKDGRNLLEIDVTNTSANRIRALDATGANWKIMRDANIVNVDYKAFEPAEWPIEPAGLLGTVELVPMETFAPAYGLI